MKKRKKKNRKRQTQNPKLSFALTVSKNAYTIHRASVASVYLFFAKFKSNHDDLTATTNTIKSAFSSSQNLFFDILKEESYSNSLDLSGHRVPHCIHEICLFIAGGTRGETHGEHIRGTFYGLEAPSEFILLH